MENSSENSIENSTENSIEFSFFSIENSIVFFAVHLKKSIFCKIQSPLENTKKSIFHLIFFNRGCSGERMSEI